MSVRKRLIAYVMCYVMAFAALPVSVAGAEGDSISADSVSSGVSSQTPTTPGGGEENKYTVTIKVNKDGEAWTDSGYSYKLKKNDETGENYITDLNNVPDGEYGIYEYKTDDSSGTPADTEIDVSVSGSDTEAEINYYTVTFYDGEKALTSPAPQTVRSGSKAGKPEDPKKTDYEFAGWVTANGGSEKFNFKQEIKNKTKVYAKWNQIQKKYKVTITPKRNNTEWTDSGYSYKLKKNDETGENYITDLNNVPDGEYRIYEYKTDDSSGTPADTEIDVSVSGSDTEAEINYYTVTFYDGEKALTSPAPQTVRSGSKAEEPTEKETPAKEGCTFAGWMKAKDGNEKFDFETDVIGDETKIYASWISIKNISYPTEFTYTGSAITTPSQNDFKNAGNTNVEFKFTWYEDRNEDGEPDESEKIDTEPSKAGKYILHVFTDENDKGAKLNVKIVINQATPAITSPTPEYKKIFGDSDFNLGFTNNNKDQSAVMEYTVKSGSDVVSVSSNGTVKILKVGTAEIIASLESTENYTKATSNSVKITITCTHKGTPVASLKDRTDTAEGLVIRKCGIPGCDHEIERFILPRKTVEVELGRNQNIITDPSKCEFRFANTDDKENCKKYFALDSKTGKITTEWNKKNNKKVKIMDSIPIVVKTGGQSYPVNVKIKFPDPKMKVKKKNAGGGYYRFKFKYDVKNAKKVMIRCKNKNIKINKKVFDYYLSSPRSGSDSYIYLHLTKIKEVTFTITAYYGKNNKRSETTEYTVSLSKKKKK